ncbi:MAG: amidase [Pseudomonadota bacterium]
MSELNYQSLSDTCRQIKSGALSSVTVTEHTLARIAQLEPDLHSYAMVLADDALAQAEVLDQQRARGEPLGALHGVPIAIKDLLFTAGKVTASGTRVMADFVPDYSATVVQRLVEAGAVIVGKTQLTEGAFGAHHPEIEAPRNPYAPDHWPGVSSSGSGVAVAAGLAYGALGTDTGGSIRFPSASCGLVGLKPTYGRVSRYGAFPLAESLDHIGPMCRTVADAARMLEVIAGVDAHDSTTLDDPVPHYLAHQTEQLNNIVVGIDWRYVTEGVDSDVVAALTRFKTQLEALGATVREVTLPAGYRRLVDEWGVTCALECARAHQPYYPRLASEYGPVLRQLLDLGLSVPQAHYDELQVLRGQFQQELDTLLDDVDMLLTPCMTSLPLPVAQMEESVAAADQRAAIINFTAPFNYSGHPTLTLPVGLSTRGLPESVQLVGRRLGEAELISVGCAYELARGDMPRPPDLQTD